MAFVLAEVLLAGLRAGWGVAGRAAAEAAPAYARQLPPPVIGKLLGLHPGTTDRWASIAGGKWARYTPPSPTQGH